MAGINIDTFVEPPSLASKNPISLLQEITVINKFQQPEYSDGEGTYNQFGCDVKVYYNRDSDYRCFHGRGTTKKAAKTEAANNALDFLREEHREVFNTPPPDVIMDKIFSNKQTFPTKSQDQLATETEAVKHQRLGLGFGQLLQKARMENGLTQKDLASKINEKPNVVVEYESGRAVPNSHIVSKLERTLRMKLVGPSAGQPFTRKK